MESHINDSVLMNYALNVNRWQLNSKGKKTPEVILSIFITVCNDCL